jgi:hypothetical protein
MPGFGRFGRPSKSLAFTVCVVLSAITAWVVGYLYLVRHAGYPSAGFFRAKTGVGVFAVSFIIFVVFRLRGFFKGPP